MSHYVSMTDRDVSRIIRAAYPDYTGRRAVRIEAFRPMSLNSYWDSGCRSYFRILDLASLRVVEVPQSGTPFDGKNYRAETLPPNAVIVERAYIGQYQQITLHVGSDNLAKLLPAPVELTPEQRTVLAATRSLKSSYAGIRDYRFYEANRETGIERGDWDLAKESLIDRRLLNRAGAITTKGRNAIGDVSLHTLKL